MKTSRAAIAALAMAMLGCSLTHERPGDVHDVPDASVLPMIDASMMREPDAFRIENDAWVAPFMTAAHGPQPIVPDQGGPRMTHPQVVAIFFADDPDRIAMFAHARWMVTSNWLMTVGPEYGVGTGSILGAVDRSENAPDAITGPQIESLLTAGIADHSLPVPMGPLSDALYIVYFPLHTTITDSVVGTSCSAFGGYHNVTTTTDGQSLVYAVIPTCGTTTPFLTAVESRQEATTHELFEAATDSHWFDAPAFEFSNTSMVLSPWIVAGAELADLCEYREGPNAYVHEAGFVATHIWSNAVSMSGDRDPCVPSDPGVPYGTVSITPDELVQVPAGGSTTFDVLAWSTAPMPAFSVLAAAAAPSMRMFAANASLDRTSLSNGDHATLTVTVPPGTPSGSYALVYVQVTMSSGDTSLLPVSVIVP